MAKICTNCKKRPAIYFSKKLNRMRSAPDHPLCRQCDQAEKDRHGHYQHWTAWPHMKKRWSG